ncbi:putative membrane protein [Pseudomonas chlororaphis subsp. aurantiaca]|nr:putative membrane protein [Pseudomonas chlororaphis subsp. aurantiaca]
MGPLRESCTPGSCDYWMVSKAAGNLANQACTLGARHIKNGTLRLQFNREVSYYASSIVNDVAQGRKSPEQGLADIKNEQSSLLSQSWEIAKKGAGTIAGAMQIVTGAGICYGSAGTLCLVAGVPMMAHGANNVYENGRNLLEDRIDTEGPVRKGYQAAAKAVGYGAREGNMVYGSADLGLSTYALGRYVLKPDAWRLFRYIRADYVRSYRNMGVGAMGFEIYTDFQTGKQVYRESGK